MVYIVYIQKNEESAKETALITHSLRAMSMFLKENLKLFHGKEFSREEYVHLLQDTSVTINGLGEISYKVFGEDEWLVDSDWRVFNEKYGKND